jgi:hypothetical protein
MTTTYHVHLYREMRVTFSPVPASSPEEAARIARQLPTDQAVAIEECEGEDLAALVDVEGDDQHEQSVTIDFEGEQTRKAAGDLLAAVRAFLEAHEMAEECHEWKWENLDHAFTLARTAVAKAG